MRARKAARLSTRLPGYRKIATSTRPWKQAAPVHRTQVTLRESDPAAIEQVHSNGSKKELLPVCTNDY